MFGSIGGAELLFVLVLALLLFGPRQLPKIGRTIGRALAEFRSASHELRTSLEQEVELEELRGLHDETSGAEREVRDALRPRPAAGSTPRGAEPAAARLPTEGPPAESPSSEPAAAADPDAETSAKP